MKKIFIAFTVVCISATVAALFTACDDENNAADDDAIYTVTEDDWKNAYDNLELLNCSLEIIFPGGTINKAKITETGVYYLIEDYIEFYSVKTADGTYNTYLRYFDNGNQADFALVPDTSDAYITRARDEMILRISFADYFDLFTYDEATKCYKCESTIQAVAQSFDGEDFMTLYCFDTVIKTEYGKIVSISFIYNTDGDLNGETAKATYYDIGTTSVEVPSDILS